MIISPLNRTPQLRGGRSMLQRSTSTPSTSLRLSLVLAIRHLKLTQPASVDMRLQRLKKMQTTSGLQLSCELQVNGSLSRSPVVNLRAHRLMELLSMSDNFSPDVLARLVFRGDKSIIHNHIKIHAQRPYSQTHKLEKLTPHSSVVHPSSPLSSSAPLASIPPNLPSTSPPPHPPGYRSTSFPLPRSPPSPSPSRSVRMNPDPPPHPHSPRTAQAPPRHYPPYSA
ncbi:hypothetical protein OF83DRAFT_899036 [Amylostereum chailletii]|nr:hypothetical protein OF83DRAFT_899036 [Amylostereum chailletii]